MAQNSAQIGFWRAWWMATGLIVLGGAAGAYVTAQLETPMPNFQPGDGELQVISRLLESTLRLSVDSVRLKALAVLNDPGASQVSGVLRSWAEVEGAGLELGAVRRSLQGHSRHANAEAASLQNVLERARQQNLGVTSPAAILVRPDPDRLNESLWLVFPTGTPGRASTLFVLVDPVEAFPLLASTGDGSAGNNLRTYLLSAESGVVLNHSTPSYIGALFKNTQVHELASRHAGSVEAVAIDRMPVLAHFEPSKGFPWIVGVEQVRSPSAAFHLNSRQQQELGEIALGLLVLSLFAARVLAQRAKALLAVEVRKEAGNQDPGFGLPAELSAARLSPPPPSAAVLAAAKGRFQGSGATQAGPITAQINGRFVSAGPVFDGFNDPNWPNFRSELAPFDQPLPNRDEASVLVTQFEKDALRLRDPRKIAARMVQEATKLTGSPTMFFAYEPQLRRAQLTVDAGLPADQAPAALSFPVDESVFKHIVDCEKRGELASLSEYPPLAQLIRTQMGIGHFEAWAVAGYGPLGPRSELPRLVGIFVLLQSSVDSYTRRDSLSRMLRATGLIYETSLQSRPNP